MIKITFMQSKKKLAKLKDENILEYVLRHGQWRLDRGKRLSATLPMPYGIFNPQKAYEAAKWILSEKENRVKKFRARTRFQMALTGQTPLEAMLGIPSPNVPPWPGARKVPFTCYEWY